MPIKTKTKTETKTETEKKTKKIKIPSGSVDTIFEHWKLSTGRKRAMLSERRSKLITKAIEGYGIDDCKRVVDGAMASSFHRGANDEGKEYLDIELLFRDAQKIEQFIGYAEKPPKPTNRHKTEAEKRVDEILEDEARRNKRWS
jgi:hypothetical protein